MESRPKSRHERPHFLHHRTGCRPAKLEEDSLRAAHPGRDNSGRRGGWDAQTVIILKGPDVTGRRSVTSLEKCSYHSA